MQTAFIKSYLKHWVHWRLENKTLFFNFFNTGKNIFSSHSLRLKCFKLKINNKKSISMDPSHMHKTSTHNSDAEEKQHCH